MEKLETMVKEALILRRADGMFHKLLINEKTFDAEKVYSFMRVNRLSPC
jgi:hypothetical protein